ncbi:MAG: response regulator [Bradymonadia bacterium]
MAENRDDRPHILIVDDEDSVRSALRRTLRKEGYRLSFASSAQEGLDLMRRDRPDVLVTDHLMPQMTGLELVKKCSLLYPHMSRIVLTGQAEIETVVSAINEGHVYRFLCKPWDDDELKLTLFLAVDRVQLERETARLKITVAQQTRRIKELEATLARLGGTAGSTDGSKNGPMRDDHGAIIISDEDLAGL